MGVSFWRRAVSSCGIVTGPASFDRTNLVSGTTRSAGLTSGGCEPRVSESRCSLITNRAQFVSLESCALAGISRAGASFVPSIEAAVGGAPRGCDGKILWRGIFQKLREGFKRVGGGNVKIISLRAGDMNPIKPFPGIGLRYPLPGRRIVSVPQRKLIKPGALINYTIHPCSKTCFKFQDLHPPAELWNGTITPPLRHPRIALEGPS